MTFIYLEKGQTEILTRNRLSDGDMDTALHYSNHRSESNLKLFRAHINGN